MKKIIVWVLFSIVVMDGMSFSTRKDPGEIQREKIATSYYFKFIGTHNSEEGDVTKWVQIAPNQVVLLGCNATHLGCMIVATEIQVINGVNRPKQIYLVAGTNDPTTGAYVSSFGNFTN